MQKLDGVGNDNLSLVQLLCLFYQKKKVFFLSVLLCLTVGTTVIFLNPPVYEAKINVLAPTDGDIATLNSGRNWSAARLLPVGLYEVTSVVNRELFSEATKNVFFQRFYQPVLQKQQLSTRQQSRLFSKAITIKIYPRLEPERDVKYTVTMRSTDPAQAAQWLMQFMSVVRERAVHVVLDDMKQKNWVIIQNLQSQIAIAREGAQLQREDRLMQLKEAESLALATDKTTATDVRVIQAEIHNLAERKSDDAFIPNLRILQNQLVFFQSIAVNPQDMTVFQLDGVITAPSLPATPNKPLILMLSLVLGLLLGAFWIMLPIAWRKAR